MGLFRLDAMPQHSVTVLLKVSLDHGLEFYMPHGQWVGGLEKAACKLTLGFA